MSNVVEVIVADINLTSMLKIVRAAGLDTVLCQKGPFTIFAPTNIAFGKMPAGRMEHLLKPENRERLNELLNHHVVDGLAGFDDLKDNQKLVTANGRELKIQIEAGKVTINGATIQSRDAIGSNGVVHSVDTVIEMNI